MLHRDIKPANILINQYGRPMLADFNLAFQSHEPDEPAAFGGTMNYMSPEHLDAFNVAHPTRPDVVREPADIFSLGVVLFELATCAQAFPLPAKRGHLADRLDQMAADRRLDPRALARKARKFPWRSIAFSAAAWPRRLPAGSPRPPTWPLPWTEPAVFSRWSPSARASRFIQLALDYPVAVLIGFAIIPHIIGSMVNISYNLLRIVNTLTPEQDAVFHRVVSLYNLVAYPICLACLCCLAWPVIKTWQSLLRNEAVPDSAVTTARLRVTRWGLWTVVVACLGWLPGGVIFPLAIHLGAGPAEPAMFWHFLVSFALSGLVAMTYAYLGVELMAVRVFYPVLLCDEREPSSCVSQGSATGSASGSGSSNSWPASSR